MQDDPEAPARDAQRTRQKILSAAQQAFSVKGYAAAGVRDITGLAGVNPALVSRYFGSKENLYREALRGLMRVDLITSIPREKFGEAVIDILTTPTDQVQNPVAMMVLASADPKARDITQTMLQDMVLEPFSRWFGGEQAHEKALQFMILASGITLYRQLYPLPGLFPKMDASLKLWLSASFQSLVDGA